MKKLLLFSCLIVFIPFIIVELFIKDEEIKFNFTNNSMVRVKHEDNSIEKVPLEEYIIGVVSGEMPISFEMEALKAQAVASRSYVMVEMEKNVNKDYDVVDTVMNQVYLKKEYLKSVWKENYVNNINKIKEAVLKTKGEYASYKGKVAQTFFFSTSPGVTENSEEVFSSKLEYLRSTDSVWDKESPVYETTKKITLREFYEKLGLQYSENLSIEITKTTSTGRIKEISINKKIFKGSEVCSKLALRSTYFNIKREKNTIIINNKGYGHGVGMSQYGAQGMAKAGYKYDEILKYYYKNIEIKKINA